MTSLEKYKMKEEQQKPNKKVLTLFLILFPSLLIAADLGDFIANIVIKAAIIFYQFVVIKAFLDDYYRYQ